MRVGLNAHFLQQPMTGSGQYTRNLFAALSELDNGDEYVLVSGEDAGGKRKEGRRRDLTKIWFEQVLAPNASRRAGIDILHYPYFAAPLVGGRRVVVTIHDVIPLLLEPYRGSTAVRMYSLLVSAAARRAAAIITDSESSKTDIIRLLRIPPERISVIYLAVDAGFAASNDPGGTARVRAKYGLPDSFILYLGGLDFRKNVVALVEAFAEARKQLNSNQRLAIAGQPLSVSPLFPDVKGAVRRLGVDEAVLLLGAVADEDRADLYRAASVFVYPSLYEGFGLPPLEAMACGVPVICSNGSSLPEVVGDAAVTFPPNDCAELTRALVRVLSDADLRAEMQGRGKERARQFSWQKTARKTADVYRSVLQRT